MDINCLPISGEDIKAGFNCTTSGGFSASSLTLTGIDGNTYVENYWTDGELIICLLLFLLFMFEVLRFGFNFFFPQIVKIKREKV